MTVPIVLLTDFGHIDPYVGQMKGVLASLAPHSPVLDLCHGVRPQAVMQAAYFLNASFMHFPEKSIFICVVDPGVGTDRRIVCASIGNRHVLAPDNGLLTPLFAEYPGAGCHIMDTDQFPDASATFHGRDIFCPLAARLACGATPAELGTPIHFSELHTPDWIVPVETDGSVECTVQHIDTFGNVVLNLPIVPWFERLASWPDLLLRLSPPLEILRTTTFGQLPRNTLGCIAGSQGNLELVLNGASAAQHLKVDLGDTITLISSFSPDDQYTNRNK
jgi:S-adenosylmethionine hydrolase